MRKHPNLRIAKWRYAQEGQLFASTAEDGNNGVFNIPAKLVSKTRDHGVFTAVISDQAGWDHVSVSLPDRCPTWDEMCEIKRLFFRDDECAVQYHPAVADYVNNHQYCLHLFRPNDGREVPMPPAEFIGIKGVRLK